MSFWRCCSTMAGSPASLSSSALASPARSSSVAICFSAPDARGLQRSRSTVMAACRSVRARCSRSSVTSSVLASLTRVRSSAVSFCAAASCAVQCLGAAQRPHRRLGLGELLARFEQGLLGAALGVGDAGELGLGLARLALHGGQQLARLRRAGLGSRATAGAGAAPRPGPCAAARRHRLPARGQPRRPGAAPPPARPAARAGRAPSGGWRRRWLPARRRRTRPSATGRPRSRPGAAPASGGAAGAAPSARRTTPICLRRRPSSSRRRDAGGQRLHALRQGGVRPAARVELPVRPAPRQRRARRGRRPAPQPAPARSPMLP